MDARHFRFLAAQPSARLKPRERFLGVPKRGLAFLLANVMLWQPMWAQAAGGIAVNGTNTTVGQAGNGVPVLNIAAPNASGLSHNQFSDYNVGSNGLILNNATSAAQSTQLGGIIVGNANLHGHAASTILNEVNGGSPSQLKGFTEVAGQAARVIVANPYGISCDGCGFINAPRVTLSTGKPVLDANGNLDHFQVDGGSVSIDGAGLNANNLDQFDIVTRSAKLNADLYAKKLNIITGTNDVAADSLAATPRTPTGTAPQLSIDSAALGGMYANTIKLVGTEQGVGVKLAGNMAASAGDIQIDVNGHLSMAQTAASGAVTANGKGIDTQGPVYAGTQLTLNSSAELVNAQSLAAKDAVNVSAQNLTNTGFIEAGVNPDNTRNSTGNVHITAQNLTNAGSVIASQDLTVSTTQATDNRDGTLSAQRTLNLTAQSLDNRNGTVISQGALTAAVLTTLDNSANGALISQGAQSISAGTFNNHAGTVSSQNTLTVHSGNLDNSLGHLVADGLLNLTASSTNNQSGQIASNHGVAAQVGSLDNSTGQVSAGDALNLGALGIINQGGIIAGANGLTVNASSLDNSASGTLSSSNGALLLNFAGLLDNSNNGALVSQAGLTVNAGSLSNQNGVVSSGGALTLGATSLNNTAGSLNSGAATHLTVQNAFTNTAGQVISAGPLALSAGSVDNRNGQLASQDALVANLSSLDNRNGTVIAKTPLTINASGAITNTNNGVLFSQTGTTTVTADSLDNSAGTVQSQTDLTVNVAHGMSNTGGALLASNHLIASARTLNNQGQIAANSIDLTATGTLDNSNGLVEASDTLNLSAAELDNQNGQLRALGTGAASSSALNVSGALNNSNGQVQTANANLRIAAQSLNNANGNVLHLGRGMLDMSLALLQNSGGSVTSNGSLVLAGNSWTNSSALQVGNLTLNIDYLTNTGTGQLLAANHFSGHGVNWSNAGQLSGDTGLDLTLSGLYSGSGSLSSLGNLTLAANTINLNDANSTIKSGAQANITADSLTNLGQLTSADNLTVAANSVNNQGTLGSGNDLLLTAASLSNSQGLVFSGGNLALHVNNLSNRYADIYSLGSLSVIGQDGTSRASDIENVSASLESAGDMQLHANTLTNRKDAFTTEDVQTYGYITRNCYDCGGDYHTVSYVADQTFVSQVLTDTPSARVQSGGNLSIDAGDVTNQYSSIAAGQNLSVTANTLSNLGAASATTQHEQTWNLVHVTDGTDYRYRDNYLAPYNEAALPKSLPLDALNAFPSTAETITVTAGNILAPAIIQAGGSVTIQAAQNLQNSSIAQSQAPAAAIAQLGSTSVSGNSTPLVVSLNAQLPPNLAQQQINPTQLPGFSLPTGQNGLFRLTDGSAPTTSTVSAPQGLSNIPKVSANSAPAQKYLIETNPALTSLKQFLSSDYLLGQLGFDPDTAYKRLGDGLYEERLIDQAIEARTGQRFIDGLTSDDATFKYLMDNAIASKDALNLQLGVSLTGAQVAALTHDIVWMEDQVVDGQHVLVPVLYLAQANNRLAPSGALIQGQDVTLISGQTLTNTGTLRATNNLNASANIIQNRGLMQADARLNLLATDSVLNTGGGILKGRDLSVTAVNGDIRNDRAVSTSNFAIFEISQTNSVVDSAARIESSASLELNAGRDIQNNGGAINAGTTATLNAGRDIKIASVSATDSRSAASKKHLYSNSQTTQYASDVQAGTDLTASAGQNLNITASHLKAGNDLTLNAAGDMNISAAANESHDHQQNSRKTVQNDSVSQVGSTLDAGGNLAINSRKDLGITASTLSANKDVAISAGQDIVITSSENENSSYSYKKKTSSFGRSSTKEKQSYSATNVASVISAGDNLTINSSEDSDGGVSVSGGRDVTVVGSNLSAGNDLLVGGKRDISVLSGLDEQGDSSKKTKSGFLGLSKSGKNTLKTSTSQVASDLQAGNDVIVAAGNDVSLRASTINAENDAELRSGLVTGTGDINLDAANDAAYSRFEKYRQKIGLSLSDAVGWAVGTPSWGGDITLNASNKSGREVVSSTNHGSQINAGEDVTLNSSRDINIVGSEINADGVISLQSGRDVNISAGTDYNQDSSWQAKKSYGLKQAADQNGYTTFVGQETLKNKSTSTTQTGTGSQLSGYDVYVNAARDIGQTGSDISADNDISMQAGRNILIGSAAQHSEKTISQSEKRSGTSTTVNYNYGNTLDSLKGAGKGDDSVSKASSTLKAIDSLNQFFAGPTADGLIGNTSQSQTVTQTSDSGRVSSLSAGNDVTLTAGSNVTVRGGLVQAGRDINVKGQDVSFDVARGSEGSTSDQTQSKGGIKGGTTGGFKLGVGGSSGVVTQGSSQQTSTPTSLMAGRDVNLQATNDLTLIGTQVSANRNINLQAGNDLSIQAAQNSHSSDDSRHSGGAEGGIAVGPSGIGVYASVNLGRGTLSRDGDQQQEAYLYAGDALNFNSGRDTVISGANLRGNQVNGDVSRNLTVSSVPDTGSVSGRQFDISATVVVGYGGSVSGSVGYGKTSGTTDWVNNQTSITAADPLNIHVGEHTQLNAALIASDTGNLNLSTNTIGFSDIAGVDKEHGFYLNVGGSYGWGAASATQDSSQTGKGKAGENGWSVEGYNYVKDREQSVRATVGAGDITVRDDAVTGANSLAGLNRDVNNAYKITKNENHTTGIYVTKSSVGAVLNPADTYQQWTTVLKNYRDSPVSTLDNEGKFAGDIYNAVSAIWHDISAVSVNINDVPNSVRNVLGDEKALDVEKSIVRNGKSIEDINKLSGADLQAIVQMSKIFDSYQSAVADCTSQGNCTDGAAQNADQDNGTHTYYTDANGVRHNVIVQEHDVVQAGGLLLANTNNFINYVNTLPVEEASLVLFSVQAFMGPAKAAVGLASNVIVSSVYGDKIQAYKQSLAVDIANSLTGVDKDKLNSDSAVIGAVTAQGNNPDSAGEVYVSGAAGLLAIALGTTAAAIQGAVGKLTSGNIFTEAAESKPIKITEPEIDPVRTLSQADSIKKGYKPCCFVAGTMVATPIGDRAIDQLKVGDFVWSKPEAGGAPFAAKILATHLRTDQPIYRLKLGSTDADGLTKRDTLLVTPGHPFYVPALHGFVPAIKLKAGDKLQSLGDGSGDDASISVDSIELFRTQGKTYNLTVDVGHTFYVGTLKTWVHNVGLCADCNNGVCKLHELPAAANGASIADGANGSSGAVALTDITKKQLDRKFKHASDFGVVTTKKNPDTIAQYEAAIKAHMDSPSTVQQGTYGFVQDSKVFFNPNTNNVVILDSAGNFVTGFKITPGTQQFDNYFKMGCCDECDYFGVR